jgi:DNA-binding transcriptional LysR family regulator
MTKAANNWEARIGRRIRLRNLHILLAVVHWRSMAKAATHLAVSQPAVSQAVSDLEHTLGVRLVDRGPKGVEATAYGHALLRRAVAAFDELRHAVSDIEFLVDPTKGELRVGCPESIVAAFLPKLIERFSHRHPQVLVHIEQMHNVSPEFRELRDRNVDLVLARTERSFAVDDLDIDYLADDRLMVAVGTQSPLTRRRNTQLKNLVDEQWVLAPTGTRLGLLESEAFDTSGVGRPKAGVVSLSTHVRCQLIGAARFVGFLPASVLRFNRERFALKALPIKLAVDVHPITVVTLKHRTLSPPAQLFVEEAKSIARSMLS